MVRAASTKSAYFRDDHLGADQAGVGNPIHQGQGDVIADEAGLQHGDDGDDQDEIGKGDGDVENAHQHRIGAAAEISGQKADGRADDEGSRHPEERHLEIDPGGIDEAGEEIAPEAVGAEPMRLTRRLQRMDEIQGDGVVVRQDGADEGDHQPEQHDADPRDERGRQLRQPAAALHRRHAVGGDAHIFTRGSRATVTTSTMKVVITTPSAKNKVTPCTTK